MKLFLISVAVYLFPASPVHATAPADTLITGHWKGVSNCQVKNSPCHDEIVVGHISLTEERDSFRVIMNKIVNGMEEEMGDLLLGYDSQSKTFVNKDPNRGIVWTFKLNGKSMEGTLYYKGELFRIINLQRQD